MSKKDEALRLANEYDDDTYISGTRQWSYAAATELRRLHAENERLREALAEPEKPAREWVELSDHEMHSAACAVMAGYHTASLHYWRCGPAHKFANAISQMLKEKNK